MGKYKLKIQQEQQSTSSSESSSSNWTDELISTDSDFYELSGGDTNDTNSDDTFEETVEQETTLLVQITETKARVTLLMDDGSMIPIQMETGFYSTPFWMALIKKKVFAFGSSVLPYARRAKANSTFKQTFWKWEIGKLLLKNFSSKASRLFVVNDTIYESTELLAGLFFADLKSRAENKMSLDNKKTIKNIVFCVPMWYGSLHRQRLIDAGKIAGFLQASVLNTISTVAYCHLLSKNLEPGTLNNFLILSESSGNVDLAFYQSKSGKYMKMIACTGNLYTSADNSMRNLIKEHYETIKGNSSKNLNVQKARIYLFRSLLLELREKLPREMDDAPLEVLAYCETPHWKPILEKEVGHFVTVYDHIGAPPVPDNVDVNDCDCTWSPPVLELRILRGNNVTDLSPFSVYRSDVIFGKWSVKLMEQDVETFNHREITSTAIYPTTRTIIYQKNVCNHILPVGTLEITRALYYTYMKMQMQWTMGKEGNIYFQSIHACKENGEFVRALQNKEEYRWTPVNLTKLEIEKFSKDLQEIIGSVKQIQNDFSKKREHLFTLCQEMAETIYLETIWFEKWKKRLGKTRIHFLAHRVDKILNNLRTNHHPLMDFEILELDDWTKEMQGYYSKYFT